VATLTEAAFIALARCEWDPGCRSLYVVVPHVQIAILASFVSLVLRTDLWPPRQLDQPTARWMNLRELSSLRPSIAGTRGCSWVLFVIAFTFDPGVWRFFAAFRECTLVADVSLRGVDLCAVCDSRRLCLVSTVNGSMASSSTRPTHCEKEGSELACFTSVVLCWVLLLPFCVLFVNAVFCIFFLLLAHAEWSSCTILVYHQRFLAPVAGCSFAALGWRTMSSRFLANSGILWRPLLAFGDVQEFQLENGKQSRESRLCFFNRVRMGNGRKLISLS